MNNSITDEYLQQFRLRTARNKKRMQYEDFEKRLRALNREEGELFNQRRNLGWIELETPIIRGWKRYFVLREDIARSRNKVFLKAYFKKINTIDYSSRKDFKCKKRKFGMKIYVIRPQLLFTPDEYYIKKHKFSEKELSFFEPREVTDKWHKKVVTKYFFTEPWRFVLRIRPNIITKVQIKDVELEQRIHQIRNYIERNDLRGTMHRLIYGHHQWRYADTEKIKERNPFKNKSLTQILDACRAEQD